MVTFQEKPKVEIYLTKTKLLTVNTKLPTSIAGYFYATKNDLVDSPFIKDSEILSYNVKRGNIKFTKETSLLISKLEPIINEGIQFVITVNKEPVLNGYFINKLTSQPVISYMIMNKNDSIYHIDRLLPDIAEDERKNENLVNAFKLTGRLE
jgi:hypothetical protein